MMNQKREASFSCRTLHGGEGSGLITAGREASETKREADQKQNNPFSCDGNKSLMGTAASRLASMGNQAFSFFCFSCVAVAVFLD